LGLEVYQGDCGLAHQSGLAISTLVDISSAGEERLRFLQYVLPCGPGQSICVQCFSGISQSLWACRMTGMCVHRAGAWQAIRGGWDGHVLVVAAEGGEGAAGLGQSKALTPAQRAFAATKRWVRLTSLLRYTCC
jgi:hypothetical protein